MKRFGYILSLIPAILIAGNCFSQQVIATAGSSGSGTGIQLSWTIGEPVTATTHGSDFYLTQGFHQSQPVTAMVNQEVSLIAGWNIFSTRIIPNDINLKNILQFLIDAGKLKKVMDESGELIEDWGVLNGGWINTIGEMKTTEGYKINVTSDIGIEITGFPLLFPFEIPLTEGWNIISWPSSGEQDGMDVFHDLIVAGKLKKVMDEGGYIIEDWGVLNGSWQNFIGNLKPGEGYKVNVNSDCMLTIKTGTKSNAIIPKLLASTHFIPAFKGNGTDHMNINLLNLAESGIVDGDEIGVFDGDICVGSAKISNLKSYIVNLNSISIPVSAEDGFELNNGYSVGNPITVKLFRNGREYPVVIEPLNKSQPFFETGGSLFAQLALPTGIEQTIKEGFTDVKVYPNPFNQILNIEINLQQREDLTVEVYDLLSRRIRQLHNSNAEGFIRIQWDGNDTDGNRVATGVYVCRVNGIWKKVVLN